MAYNALALCVVVSQYQSPIVAWLAQLSRCLA